MASDAAGSAGITITPAPSITPAAARRRDLDGACVTSDDVDAVAEDIGSLTITPAAAAASPPRSARRVHEILARILFVTLAPSRLGAVEGERAPLVLTGIAEPGTPALLSLDNLEEAMVATLLHIQSADDQWSSTGSLPYFAACYARADVEHSRAVETAIDAVGGTAADPRVAAAKQAMKMIVTFSTTTLLEPDFIAAPEEPTAELMRLLGGSGAARHFVTAVLGEATTDGRATEMCLPLVRAVNHRALRLAAEIGQPAGAISLVGAADGDAMLRAYDYPSLIALIVDLCQHKPIAAALVASSTFLSRGRSAGAAASGRARPASLRELQTTTLLGAIFSFDATSSAQLRATHFQGDPKRAAQAWHRSTHLLQAKQRAVQDLLKRVVDGMLRASKTSLERVCEWIEHSVQLLAQPLAVHNPNAGPALYRPESELFALNLCAVCLQLCRPFMMPAVSEKKQKSLKAKQAKIDLDFPAATRGHCAASFYAADETPLCRVADADAEGAESGATLGAAVLTSATAFAGIEGTRAPRSYGFICRIFWLTARAVQFGINGSARASKDDVDYFQRLHHATAEAQRGDLITRFEQNRAVLNVARLQPEVIADALLFASLVATVLVDAFRAPGAAAPPAGGGAAAGGGTLPATPNRAALLTMEHVVDDVVVLLKDVVATVAPLAGECSFMYRYISRE
jgi:hypothetical protein